MDNETKSPESQEKTASEGSFGNHPLSSNMLSASPPSAPTQMAPAPFQLLVSPAGGPVSSSEGDYVGPAGSAPGTSNASGPVLQRYASNGPIQRTEGDENSGFRFEINVPRAMNQEEFKAYVLQQIFGRHLENLDWTLNHETYTPENNPYIVRVHQQLYRRYFSQATEASGIETDESGGVAGADERAQEFSTLGRSEQSDINDEINRRYWEATGQPEGTQIDPDDASAVALWRMQRDRVLFQREYLGDLPEAVQQLIRQSVNGRPMNYQELDRLFDLARMIEDLPPERVRDYASRINASTTSLDDFEASIRSFNGEMDSREDAQAEHRAVQTRIYGLEETYQLYLRNLAYRHNLQPGSYIAALFVDMPFEQTQRELDASLRAHNFANEAEFESYINRFIEGFQAQAALTFDDTMARYDGTMYQEQQRYQSEEELTALQEAIRSGNTDGFPVLNDEGMPDDRRVPRDTWAAASTDQLRRMVQSYIATRRTDVTEARGRVSDNPSLVFKLEGMFPLFYASQGFSQGTIEDLIIQNKIQEDAIAALVIGIVSAIVAIALTVVSLGTATPAIVAAGAAAGAFGISAYFAYEEFQNYVVESDLADVGLMDDPSIVWLVIAVVGATVDMAAAVRAVRALAPAARILNTSGDVAQFQRAVQALDELGEIDGQILRAADQAAAARGTFQAASSDLAVLMSRVSSNPFLDPEIYTAMVRMAAAKISEGVAEFRQFVLQLRAAKTAAGLAEGLSPEELARAREAWEQALIFVNSADEPVEILSSAGRPMGTFSRGNALEIASTRNTLHGGNTITLAPDRTTTILGSMNDVGVVRRRGLEMIGVTMQGSNPGAINSLFSPRWRQIMDLHNPILEAGDSPRYWRTVTSQFWDEVNGPWIREAIERGDQIRLVSNPDDAANLARILEDGTEMQTIFARELAELRAAGYRILDNGMAIPPSGG